MLELDDWLNIPAIHRSKNDIQIRNDDKFSHLWGDGHHDIIIIFSSIIILCVKSSKLMDAILIFNDPIFDGNSIIIFGH